MMSFKSWAIALLKDADITLGGKNPGDMVVHDDRVYLRVGYGGAYCLGNTYVDGMWDCDNLDVFFDKTSSANLQRRLSLSWDRMRAIRDYILNSQSVRRALEVGRKHYDLGNDFYELMLGPSMGYSSAYFADDMTNLDDAQFAKFDKICKLLEMKSGMRILEIGCGWGTFARYASQKYGVEIDGISISKEQLAYAKEINKNTPNKFHFLDYRHLPKEWLGAYDAVVSIEMIEAVGPKNLPAYFNAAYSALKRDGMFALQAIIGGGEPDVWLSTHIFPNGVLPSVSQLGQAIQGIFDIKTWESFGPDYDRTLMEWHKRFESAWPVMREMRATDGSQKYDERFRRMWRYYLLQCAGIFRSQYIDVAQISLRRR